MMKLRKGMVVVGNESLQGGESKVELELLLR